MRSSTVFGVSLLSLALPFAALADTHALRSRNHHQIAKRASGEVLEKRFSNARFTFYDVGLGACGKTNVPSDYIVALNTPQFTANGNGYPGPECFKMISINYGGKTTTAQIMDECPGCPYGGLDMSRGLFDFFASEDLGVLYGTWEFTDGSGGGDAPAPKPKSTKEAPPPPKTTSTPPPPPKTSSTPPPPPPTTHKSSTTSTHTSTTTSSTPTTTSHSSSSTTHTTSSSSSSSSSAPPTTSSAAPTATPPNVEAGPAAGLANILGAYTVQAGQPQNLNNANQALIGISGLINAGVFA